MTAERDVDRFLDRVPGYDGYRDRELLRDADRAIREQLARDYAQLAERLGRLATRLANDRKLTAVTLVDRPHKRLMTFIDRIRTATYGYAPLFSGAPVREVSLRQLAEFDRALAEQQAIVSGQIDALESAHPESDEFQTATAELQSTVDQLHQRFDKREEVISSGEPLPERDVLELLGRSRGAGSPTAFRLHQGEAVSYDGVDYTITGRVTAETEREVVRAFQLRGGAGDNWLQVSADPNGPTYWLRRIDLDNAAGSDTITLDGSTFSLAQSVTARGEVIGELGSAEDQMVRYMRYVSPSDQRVLFVYDWGGTVLALVGLPVDPLMMELYTREM